MHTQLKNAMRSAGIEVSEGDELAQSDLQLARDFMYFTKGVVVVADDFSMLEAAPTESGVDDSPEVERPDDSAPKDESAETEPQSEEAEE